MEVVDEKSTAYLTATFKNKVGVEEQPTSISYRIDTLAGTEIRGDTVITPASSVEITLAPSDNAIINSGKLLEGRRLTLSALYGLNDGVNKPYIWNVRNLAKVS